MFPRILALATLLAGLATVVAVPPAPYTPKVQPASDEPDRAVKRIKIPEGMKIDLWAAEPLLANPVIFCMDHKGRVYVAETFRLHKGVTDIRGYLKPGPNFWLDEDLACRTVADRIALMKRRLTGKQYAEWSQQHERIRLLEDDKQSGKATRSTVFADGFNRIEDGLGAGLLARGRDVFYTCIPDLWRLRDTKGTGKADQRERLHTGFGVHIGYIGHDMHGLVMGPDGKLYFSIGDRGLNVKTKDGHLNYPDCGSVLRCNLDGSDLEVFATGLRNPQELAFDQYGNLFTGDNNSDGGDKARWVYLVEGGDSGWRIGYQFGGSQGNRGPWNAEKLWHPPHAGQPAWVIPPIINIADGPSGLAYYPGVGLPASYDEHFFLADFRGGSGSSGIRSFAVKQKGAGFELVDAQQPIWGVLATDVDFGPDGCVYVSDWVDGWGLTGKGRIWKISDPKSQQDPLVAQTRALLGEGMEKRSDKELARLLEHRDLRVRQEAQFQLAARGKATTLADVLKSSKSQLARLHAIWGLGQIGRKESAQLEPVLAVLGDEDQEVRAQAARVLGDCKLVSATPKLIERLADSSVRVQFFLAQALEKLKSRDAFGPLVRLLRTNADRDLYLRHAASQALATCGDLKQLAEAAQDASPAVRRAVVLAYRKLESPEVARLLDDADVEIVAEAARAINDVPIEAAFPKLASLIGRQKPVEPVAFRVLNAQYRLGTADNARAVARFAARSDVSEALRVEALQMIRDWEKPNGRDRILGIWRPLQPRPAGVAAAALRPALGAIFTGPNRVRQQAAKVAASLGIKEIGPTLFELIADTKQPAEVRVETLRALAALKDDRLDKAIEVGLADTSPEMRGAARSVLAEIRPADAIEPLTRALEAGTTREQQQAFEALGKVKSDRAEPILNEWVGRLVTGKVKPEVRLDLLEAVQQRGTPALQKSLRAYEKQQPKDEPFGKYRESIVGGDARVGRQIFLNRSEVSCLRCHKAGKDGVGEVGPDLTGIGSKQKREYLLESLVHPSKQIAKGFETVDVVLTTGQLRSGIVKAEDARTLKLMTAEGTLLTINKSLIEERRSGKSAMPEDLVKHLSPRDMRDLVEFLAGLKEEKK